MYAVLGITRLETPVRSVTVPAKPATSPLCFAHLVLLKIIFLTIVA
jgi:hypothetical protein